MTLSAMLRGFIRRHLLAYLSAAAMLLTIAIITAWIPRHVGHVVDGLAKHTLAGPTLAAELAWLLLAGAAIYLLRVGWRMSLFRAAYQLGRDLRTQLYRQLSLQGPAFFQAQRTGDLMALATNDIDAVEMAAGEAMLAAFDGTLTFALVLGMMTVAIDWRLGLAALAPFPFMAWAFKQISEKVHHAWQQSLSRFSKVNQHAQDSLAGVRTIKALGLTARSAQQFRQLADEAGEASYQAQRWEAAYEPAVGMALTGATVIALGYGAYLLHEAEITLGQLTAFTMYLGQLIWPMFAAGWVISLLERGRAAWSRLEPVLSAPLTLHDEGQAVLAAPVSVQLSAVHFTYPARADLQDPKAGQVTQETPGAAPDAAAAPVRQARSAQAAVTGVSLDLPAGQTLGLVGATGSGKSTLVKLLLRQFEPGQGEVRLNGQPASDFTLSSLRQQVAWVPQEPFLFSASIADNIALARPGATREQVQEVARLAAVHDDIVRLPQGYDTLVGERGITLSGGQRQRVAIARALLMDAPLLILDDALSAVDTGTEAQILRHLRQARSGRTVIIVSHRLSAVMDADQIVVLRHGQVAERGAHEALVAAGHWYSAQWRYQQLEASLQTSLDTAP